MRKQRCAFHLAIWAGVVVTVFMLSYLGGDVLTVVNQGRFERSGNISLKIASDHPQSHYHPEDYRSHQAFDAPSIVDKVEKSNDLEIRLTSRLTHIRRVCSHSNYSLIKTRPTWDEFAFGRLSLCSIPKCGSTFITRVLLPTLEKLDDGNSSFPDSQKKRFVIVREPFSRLVSAFFSKIVGHPYWWPDNGAYIIRPIRPNASKESIRCGHDVTFPEYIKFVIDMHGDKPRYEDAHYQRMISLCNVCVDVPDFVVKLEHMKEEMLHILKAVNVTGKTDQKFIEVKHLAKIFMSYNESFKDCGPMCPILERYWWGQQATGLISLDTPMPLQGQACEDVTGEQLAAIAWAAHQQSVDKIDKQAQKTKVMADLFRQVALDDREKIAKLLSIECRLFGYDPRPSFVFPER